MPRKSFPAGDLYQILEVSKKATLKEIKEAHKRLVLQYHPDKAGSSAENNAKFSQIRDAYEILSDWSRRAEYDQHIYNLKDSHERRRQEFRPSWPIQCLGKMRVKADLWLMNIAKASDKISMAVILYHRCTGSTAVNGAEIDNKLQEALKMVDSLRSGITRFKDHAHDGATEERHVLKRQFLRLSQVMAQFELFSSDVTQVIRDIVAMPQHREPLVTALNDILVDWINLGKKPDSLDAY